MNQVAAELAKWPMFSSLPEALVCRIAAGAQPVSVRRGELLFRRGAPASGFYGVLHGLIQLSMSNAEGMVKVVEIIGPGETLGEAMMFLRRRFPVDALALADTGLIFIPAAVVDENLDQEADFARALLASMAVRLHTRVKDIEMYTLRSATQRLIGHLLGELDDDGTVTLSPSKQVLASRLGMTPETLSRTLRDLAGRGVITARGNRLHIPDVDALVDQLQS